MINENRVKNEKILISAEIKIDQKKALEAISKRTDLSVSFLIRKAITELISKEMSGGF